MKEDAVESRCTWLLTILMAVALLAGAAILVPWWSHWQASREAADLEQTRIDRYRALLQSRDRLAKASKELSARLHEAKYFIVSPGSEVAAAELQQNLKAIIQNSGGTLVSTQALPSPPDKRSDRIDIKVHMQGSTAALARTLMALQRHRPITLVTSLQVRSHTRYRRQGKILKVATDAPLDIVFEVSGWLWEDEP
jgi:general secretion pathway protein M